MIETILTSDWRIGVTASDRSGGNTRRIAFDSLQSAGKLVGVIDKDTNTVEIQIDH